MICKRCGCEIERIDGSQHWWLTDKACEISPEEVGIWCCDDSKEGVRNSEPEERHEPLEEYEIVTKILDAYN